MRVETNRNGGPAVAVVAAMLFLIATGTAFAQDGDFKEVEQDGFTLRWRVSGDNVEVEVEAETSGWIAVGFDPSRRMKDANMIIGYVAGGEASVSDQFGTSATGHKKDVDIGGSNDLLESDVTESNGRTRLRFVIPLDSGDDADQPLTPGSEHTVLLAAGGSDDFTTYHGGTRTVVRITL